LGDDLNSYKLEELCLEVTKECLLDCLHCSTDAAMGKEVLDTNVSIRTINDFEALGGKQLELSGGDPLLDPDIWKILDHCKGKPFQTTLYTTGIANMPVPEIVKKLDVDRVAISLQEPPITSVNYSSTTKKFMKGLIKKGIETTVHFVPMKLNYKNFDKLFKECEEMGVKEVKILRLIPQGRALQNWDKIHLPEMELKRFIEEVSKKHPSKVKLGDPTAFYSDEKGHCKAATSTCLIDPLGDVYPCPALKTRPTLSAGNVYEQSLREIWEKGFESIRRSKEISGYTHCLAPWIKSPTFEEAIIEIKG